MASSSPPLTSSFAAGWRSLPNELKLEVLSYIIPRHKILTVDFIWDSIRPRLTLNKQQLRKQHHWLSALINNPDFNALALDLLFANNTVEIVREVDLIRTLRKIEPVYDIIQHLCVIIKPKSSHWDWLAFFETFQDHSRSLSSFEVVIDLQLGESDSPFGLMFRLETATPITINTRRLTLAYQDWEDSSEWPDNSADLTNMIRAKLSRKNQ